MIEITPKTKKEYIAFSNFITNYAKKNKFPVHTSNESAIIESGNENDIYLYNDTQEIRIWGDNHKMNQDLEEGLERISKEMEAIA